MKKIIPEQGGSYREWLFFVSGGLIMTESDQVCTNIECKFVSLRKNAQKRFKIMSTNISARNMKVQVYSKV